MATQFVTVPHKDISKGIDVRSVPSNLQDGFSEDLINVETNGQGHLLKRKGYQGYAGFVPIRARKIEYTDALTNNIFITLDGSINLQNVGSSPIVVFGRTEGAQAGDFTNINGGQWYPSFVTSQPFLFSAGTHTLTFDATDHGFSTDRLWVGLGLSTAPTGLSNEWFQVDSIVVDSITFQVSITYTSATSFRSFVYISDKTPLSGTIYERSDSLPSGLTTISIPAATHNLSNFSIIGKWFIDSGTSLEEVIPDEVRIDVSGNVEVDVVNGLATPITLLTVLEAAPIANFTQQVCLTGSTTSITVSGIDHFFQTSAVYLEDLGTSELTLVLPDSIVVDSTAGTITWTVTNSTANAMAIKIFYTFEDIAFNTLIVSGTPITSGQVYTDTSPQLTVWGIDHAGIYTDLLSKGGHVNHIDTYKSEADKRLMCGLGGNLFTAKEWVDVHSAYLLPVLYPDMRNRVGSDIVVGPAFWSSVPSLVRTRGYLVSPDVDGGNQLLVLSNVYNSGTGWVDVTLQATGKTIVGTPITTDDQLTLNNMGWSTLQGTFPIMSVADLSPDTLTISISIPSITSSDFDEINGVGFASVMTDKIPLTLTNKFLVDDAIKSDLLSKTATASSGSYIMLGELTSLTALPSGLRLTASRTGSTFTVRNNLDVPSVENLVVGDMLVVDGFEQLVRVKAINVTTFQITLDESLTLEDKSDNSFELYPHARWIPVEAPTVSGDLPKQSYISHFDTFTYDEQPTLRSVMAQDNMYLTNGSDEVMKYDSTSLYKAGLYRWQPGLFVQLDDTVGSIVPDLSPITASAKDATERSFTVPTTIGFSAGQRIYDVTASLLLTVKDVDTAKIYVDEDISGAGSTDVLQHVATYKYYFRLNAIDINSNIIASAATSAQDFVVEVYKAGQVKLRLVGLPTFEMYDYDRIEVQVYRTLANTSAPFYLIQSIPIPFNAGSGYIDVIDSASDFNLTTLDSVSTALLASEIGTAWSQPLRTKYMTDMDNRLFLANVKDFPQMDIQIRKIATDMSASVLSASGESRWLFRKSNYDVGTATDMVNRVAYQFVNSGETTITPGGMTPAISYTATTFTVLTSRTDLSVGDWVYLFHSATGLKNLLTYAGWWQISAVSSGVSFMVNKVSVGTGSSSSDDVDRFVTATSQEDVPIWLGTDGNYNMTNGNSTNSQYEFVAMRRMANAMNASMVNCDRTVSVGFQPWLVGNAGNEYSAGQLIVKQYKAEPTTLELVLDSSAGLTFDVFVNELSRSASEQISAVTRLFPSRILMSYRNFAELFDNPATPSDIESDSAIDVNPDDGQEITGMIPFFGTSAFGVSATESYLVVFKTYSIYLINTANKFIPGALVCQKLDTRGLGCTAPYSIASTENGIIFANASGIYRLNKDLTTTYIGRHLERFWQEDVNHNNLEVASGHHYAFGHQYKLSVPYGADLTNSRVFVYDYTREIDQGSFGAWTRYDNHETTGWSNLEDDGFFGATYGQIMSIRKTGSVTDFRDDDAAIAMEITYKACDFGDSSKRKVCYGIVTHIKADEVTSGTTVEVANDLKQTFEAAGALRTPASLGKKIASLRASMPTRRFLWLQAKFKNSTKDEPCEIAGIDFIVGGLTHKGIMTNTEVSQD